MNRSTVAYDAAYGGGGGYGGYGGGGGGPLMAATVATHSPDTITAVAPAATSQDRGQSLDSLVFMVALVAHRRQGERRRRRAGGPAAPVAMAVMAATRPAVVPELVVRLGDNFKQRLPIRHYVGGGGSGGSSGIGGDAASYQALPGLAAPAATPVG